MAVPKMCQTCGVEPKLTPQSNRFCLWCWLPRQPAEEQVRQARYRRSWAEQQPGYVERSRVPQAEWPAGKRFCSGCQMMVPLLYARGSQCIGHASLSAHASHLRRTYKDFTREDFDELYAWQDGRCYICGQRQQKQRLAVDHDHFTDVVRGLLCSSDEWGCNHRLVGALEGKAGDGGDILDLARRIVAYFEKSPLERMRDGESPLMVTPRRAAPPVRPEPPSPSWTVDCPPPF